MSDCLEVSSKVEKHVISDYDHSWRKTSRVTFNDDVIIEILLWLPAKLLIRFKLVCKQWQSFISSHSFCLIHTKRHPNPQRSLLLCTRTSQFFHFCPTPLSDAKLVPYHFTFPDPQVLSSCNGLMLLQCDHPVKTYYVFNPTTRQSRIIILPGDDEYIYVLGLNLAFDPKKSPHYKIICIKALKYSSSTYRRSCQIDIYDSESCTWSWRVCLKPFKIKDLVEFYSGVYLNNVIHWIKHGSDFMYYDMDKNVIGTFPNVEVPWDKIRLGDACHSKYEESHHSLYHYMICHSQGRRGRFIGVYELQMDYSGWLLKYFEPFERLPAYIYLFTLLREEGKNILIFHVPGRIMAYKFLDKSYKELVDFTSKPFYQAGEPQFDERNVYQFIETLTLV